MLSGNSQTGHTHCASVHQAAKLVAGHLRVARVTAGLVESDDCLPWGLWLTSPAGWLPRTGISSGTLRSVIKYGLPYLIMDTICFNICMLRTFFLMTARCICSQEKLFSTVGCPHSDFYTYSTNNYNTIQNGYLCIHVGIKSSFCDDVNVQNAEHIEIQLPDNNTKCHFSLWITVKTGTIKRYWMKTSVLETFYV